jgi:hypothetical protein
MAESYIKKVVAGGLTIQEPTTNVIVEDGQTIVANDFLEKLDFALKKTFTNQEVTGNANYGITSLNSVKLDSTRFVISYTYYFFTFFDPNDTRAGGYWSSFFQCRVVKYENNIFTFGAAHGILNSNNTFFSNMGFMSLISTNKIIIIYRNALNNNWISGRILNISNLTISNAASQSTLFNNDATPTGVVALSNNRAIMAYTDNNSFPRVKVISFSNGSSFEDNNHSDTVLISNSSNVYITKYDDTSVMVSYNTTNSARLRFITSSSGTSLTLNTEYTLSGTNQNYYSNPVVVNSNVGVIFGYRASSPNKTLLYRFSINGPNKTISFTHNGELVADDLAPGVFDYISQQVNALLFGNTILIQLVTGVSNALRFLRFIKITDTSYELGAYYSPSAIVIVSEFTKASIALDKYVIFSDIYFVNIEEKVKATNNFDFYGIAKTDGTAGQTVEVYTNG